MPTFVGAHPEFAKFGDWAKNGPWTGSYAEERFNSLNSFIFTDNSGGEHAVRWSMIPAAQPVAVSPEELAKRGHDFLEQEIAERIRSGPLRWTLSVTVANPGDPTADPTVAWPEDRRTIEVGTLDRAEDRGRGRWPVSRHQLRSDRPAERHTHVGRSVPGGAVGGLCEVLRPAHIGG